MSLGKYLSIVILTKKLLLLEVNVHVQGVNTDTANTEQEDTSEE